jgi:hypothetical protein
MLDNMLDLDPILELSKNNIEIIDSKSVYRIGTIPVWHGHEFRNRVQASKILGKDNASGHSHKPVENNRGTIFPTLEDQDLVGYGSFENFEWVNGWGFITEVNGITNRTQNLYMKNNKFHDLESIVQITEPVDCEVPDKITIEYDLAN